jgi:hypothetical protein
VGTIDRFSYNWCLFPRVEFFFNEGCLCNTLLKSHAKLVLCISEPMRDRSR